MGSPYVELRARSAFSFLEGATAPEELAESAAALGYDAIALGDCDGVYGAPRFYQAARQFGLRAMVGAELTLDDASFDDRLKACSEPARLYVLVPDRERYKNLCRLITASKLRIIGRNTDGSPKYPAKGQSRVSLDDLESFGRGMIVLAGSAASSSHLPKPAEFQLSRPTALVSSWMKARSKLVRAIIISVAQNRAATTLTR